MRGVWEIKTNRSMMKKINAFTSEIRETKTTEHDLTWQDTNIYTHTHIRSRNAHIPTKTRTYVRTYRENKGGISLNIAHMLLVKSFKFDVDCQLARYGANTSPSLSTCSWLLCTIISKIFIYQTIIWVCGFSIHALRTLCLIVNI